MKIFGKTQASSASEVLSLSAKLKKRLPHFSIDVELDCRPGRILALIGPSGSGKTSILRMIAGLDVPDHGLVEAGGLVLTDTTQGLHLPPGRRMVGLVFQDYELFPHMSLEQNVLFAAEDNDRARRLMNVFGLERLAGMKPDRLSGGERQRGSLCQALAREPRVLLLDEPFSALDVENRLILRGVLKQVARELKLPVLHVTHDLAEAMVLGDETAALRNGRIDPEWEQAQRELLMGEARVVLGRCSKTFYERGCAAHAVPRV
jgi:molybdate transport system ATP-binding protein